MASGGGGGKQNGNWAPGEIARRAQSLKLHKQLYVVAWLVVAAIAVMPATWLLEQTGVAKAERNLWPIVSAAVATAAALGILRMVYRRRDALQKRNGTLFYFGSQFGEDTDVSRVQGLINASRYLPFDSPLAARSDRLNPGSQPHRLSQQMTSNLRYLLNTNDDGTATNLITNLPWTFGVVLGWMLSEEGDETLRVKPENLYFWHLRKMPDRSGTPRRWWRRRQGIAAGEQRHQCHQCGQAKDPVVVPYERSLVDVARGSGLADKTCSQGCWPVSDYSELGKSETRVGASTVMFECTDEPFDAEAPSKEAVTRYAGFDNRKAESESDSKVEEKVAPEHLQLLAARLAAILAEELQRTRDRGDCVVVYARVPKPVSVALGYSLGQAHGVTRSDMERIRFARYNQGSETFEFDALVVPKRSKKKDADTPPPGSLSSPRLVNLTPHPVDLLDVDDKLIESIPASGTEARVAEQVIGRVDVDVSATPVPSPQIYQANVTGLPDAAPNTLYITSQVTAAAVPERTDVVFPHDLARDERGAIIGCRALGRFSPLALDDPGASEEVPDAD